MYAIARVDSMGLGVPLRLCRKNIMDSVSAETISVEIRTPSAGLLNLRQMFSHNFVNTPPKKKV